MFALAEPFDGKTATAGNGTMVGFSLGSSSEVERMYNKALAMGGINEGMPEIRSGRFSAYVRDLDKNKICLFE
jgi:predicted lactoylglutathione lyase